MKNHKLLRSLILFVVVFVGGLSGFAGESSSIASVELVEGKVFELAPMKVSKVAGPVKIHLHRNGVEGKIGPINALFIARVEPGSPHEHAGLKKYDLIVSIGGKSYKNENLSDAEFWDDLDARVVKGDYLEVVVAIPAKKVKSLGSLKVYDYSPEEGTEKTVKISVKDLIAWEAARKLPTTKIAAK